MANEFRSLTHTPFLLSVQMPVVSRSDCTQVDLEPYLRVTHDGSNLSVHQRTAIAFNACEGVDDEENDLLAHYQLMVEDGRATERELAILQETIVGEEECEAAIEDFLN